MWIDFVLAYLFGTLIIYLPGFFLLRTLNFTPSFSVLLSPIASIGVFITLTILYGFLAIPCSPVSVFIFPTLSFVILSFLSRRKGKDALSISFSFSKIELCILLLYIAIGILLCTIFFVKPLDGPNSFSNGYDNITHLNLVRSFLESGTWSTLTTSNYLSTEISPMESFGNFYPSGWHHLVALTAQSLNVSIPLSANAINAVLISIVYPSSIFFLLYSLFKKDHLLIICGSIIALGFTAFPWSFFFRGPLYSNLISFCLMPLVLAAFVLFIQHNILKSNPLRFATIAIISVVALAATQTNTLFSCLIFITSFLASYLYNNPFFTNRIPNKRILGPVFVITLATIVWATCLNLPFLQSVVTFNWKNDLSTTNALFTLGSLALSASVPQIVLAILVPVGVIFLVSKKTVWLLFPALFMAIAYLECRCGSDPLKHLLAGFWYTDSYRLAGNLAIFLIPIAASGLRTAISLIKTVLDNCFNDLQLITHNFTVAAIVLFVFICINYFPNYTYPKTDQKVTTAFGFVYQEITKDFSTKIEQPYNIQEQEFIEKVLKITQKDSLIINQPNDGSIFAYGINGINTYYRLIILPNETDESKTVRTELNTYTENKEVWQAVKATGAKYVLLLDKDAKWADMPKISKSKSAQPENWIGIDSIDDSTPGFKVILAEDDMRLYEIEPFQ